MSDRQCTLDQASSAKALITTAAWRSPQWTAVAQHATNPESATDGAMADLHIPAAEHRDCVRGGRVVRLRDQLDRLAGRAKQDLEAPVTAVRIGIVRGSE